MKNKVSKELKRFNYLFGETDAVYHEMYLKSGLADSAGSILYAILENGGSCLLKSICHYTGRSKQTINSAIRKLEAENIIYLKMAKGKNKMVHFTEAGQILAKKTVGRILKAEDEIFASWSREDVEKYLQLTERYMIALKEKAKEM